MLLKPLKVKMGHKEGEVGLDHGGVTYEFFRVVLSEAFRPENGELYLSKYTNPFAKFIRYVHDRFADTYDVVSTTKSGTQMEV